MNETRVTEQLITDLHTNIQWFEFGALVIGCVLLIISTTIAMRAYAVLSEVRLAALPSVSARPARSFSKRRATAETIGAVSRARRVRAHQRTLP